MASDFEKGLGALFTSAGESVGKGVETGWNIASQVRQEELQKDISALQKLLALSAEERAKQTQEVEYGTPAREITGPVTTGTTFADLQFGGFGTKAPETRPGVVTIPGREGLKISEEKRKTEESEMKKKLWQAQIDKIDIAVTKGDVNSLIAYRNSLTNEAKASLSLGEPFEKQSILDYLDTKINSLVGIKKPEKETGKGFLNIK